MMKRAFDLCFSLLALAAAAPLLLAAALLIKLTSRGPVLFRQERIGRGGRPFVILKLRTMVHDAADRGPGISGRGDPRETRIGRLLRITKMDELPQLLNILRGEMSVVGPRPEIGRIVATYTAEQRQVLAVRPGLVGPAQILGRDEAEMMPESLTDVESYYTNCLLPDKLEIDLEYAARPRLLNDLRWIWRGIKATLGCCIRPLRLTRRASWPTLFYLDMTLVAFCYLLAYVLRFEWMIPEWEWVNLARTLPVVITVRAVCFIAFHLYRSLYKYIGLPDLLQVLRAVLYSSMASVILIFFIGWRDVSRSVFLIDFVLLLAAMAGVRLFLRLQSEKEPPRDYSQAKRVLVIGAGEVGEMLAREQNRNGHNFQVVGFIDDNPVKIGTTLHGLPVLGDRKAIPAIAASLHAEEILIAISSIAPEALRDILSWCEKSRLKHRVVPAISDVVSGRIHLSRARDVDAADLLGRRMLSLDLAAIRKFIARKRVLITGAGGSIGSELAKQIATYQPQSIMLLDRSENYLFELQHEINGAAGTRLIFTLGDVTDAVKMSSLCDSFKPQIIFHAAAQKHVPLSESNPDEAVRTNILGSRIMACCADRCSTDHFVFVSTDKAVNPVSVMGATKRVVELYFQAFAACSPTRFITVRFGNVLGSHGSVVPLFMKQINSGGPVTITDRHIERFFMSIPEAVNLILQAVTMGESGAIYVLNMGQRVRIEKLAVDMIRRAGYKPYAEIAIKEVGLRPGEKLFEELVGAQESCIPTAHRLINRITPDTVCDLADLEPRIDALIGISRSGLHDRVRRALAGLVPEYRHEAGPGKVQASMAAGQTR